jgi:hypothetical protein
MCKRNRELNK